MGTDERGSWWTDRRVLTARVVVVLVGVAVLAHGVVYALRGGNPWWLGIGGIVFSAAAIYLRFYVQPDKK